jgi:hypothetical protein
LRTLIVSDLHLGGEAGLDLLRLPAPRAALFEALHEDVDRLVLLGDVLELRHGPRHAALNAARPFFEELGGALAGREIVVLAGNHDHALIETWLQRRGVCAAPTPLGSEQRFAAAEGSPMLAALAEWASPANLLGAYPGVWVRPDVYATHGHYLDCHIRLPTLERLGIGLTGRLQHRQLTAIDGADDYEAVMSPVYAWVDAMAQPVRNHATLDPSSVRAWRALGGDHNHRPPDRRTALRNRVLARGFPLAVAALNRVGLGPFSTEISAPALRRAGLAAMGEVVRRLHVDDASYTVFGHTHRSGPLPQDDWSEWRLPGGTQLINSGCWTYDSYFLGSAPSDSPYWPGGCVVVDDDGPPELRRLLAERSHAELAPTYA